MPENVIATRPRRFVGGFFWVHYVMSNLAKELEKSLPFHQVSLREEDYQGLRDRASLEEIAQCFVTKIRITQPTGPYSIGGLCVGGILAYEIAAQLRRNGENVALVVLLDAPNPASPDLILGPILRFGNLGYLMKRAMRIGPRGSMTAIMNRVQAEMALSLGSDGRRAVAAPPQNMTENAAKLYRPKPYDSDVLLLQASNRSRYVDLQTHWEALVPKRLFVREVQGHHSEFMSKNMQDVAAAILSHLSIN